MRSRRSIVLACVLLVAVPALAFAAFTQVNDAQGDGARFDIASASVVKTPDGMLRHEIVTYGEYLPFDLLQEKGPPPALCFLIWTVRVPGEGRPDYQLCASATSDGRKLRGTLARIPASGYPNKTKAVEVDRSDAKTVALEVTPKQLGNPRNYRFIAQSQDFGASCDRYIGCADFAPDRTNFKTFKP
ncbi:MAG: hypothetical protein JHC87_01630 [Thermoleophilaceae bacterium]|nr:hypothetical protein [Thermoleophilaceae bacterium]